MTELDIGELSYRQGDRTGYLAVTWGYCEVLSNQVIVLAERADRAEEVDRERAQASMDRANKRLANLQDPDIDFLRARTSLQRASDSGAGESKNVIRSPFFALRWRWQDKRIEERRSKSTAGEMASIDDPGGKGTPPKPLVDGRRKVG